MSTKDSPAKESSKILSASEIEQFHDKGYLGPYTLCSPDDIAPYRKNIEQEILSGEATGPNPGQSREQSRHLDKRMIFELCSHPDIIDRIASLMGPDLMLWRSHLFNKEPGGKTIPWHQDVNYWPIEPLINISAWVALDKVTEENSCVQLIPGSHKKMIPHIASSDGMEFVEMADPAQVDASKAIKMELQPGQFFLFTDRLLHYSDPNRSSKRRMGFSLRVTVPWVRIDHEALFAEHRAILLRGEDRFGFNRLTEPPAS